VSEELPTEAELSFGTVRTTLPVIYGTAIRSVDSAELWDFEEMWRTGDSRTPEEAWASVSKEFEDDREPDDADTLVLVWRVGTSEEGWMPVDLVGVAS